MNGLKSLLVQRGALRRHRVEARRIMGEEGRRHLEVQRRAEVRAVEAEQRVQQRGPCAREADDEDGAYNWGKRGREQAAVVGELGSEGEAGAEQREVGVGG